MAKRTEKQLEDRRRASKAFLERNPGYASAKKKRNRKRNPLKTRGARLKKRYGITNDDYDNMVSLQEGKCAICKLTPNGQLVVDHNHSTNKVRELLCDKCNQAIGLMKESIDTLLSAVEYIRKHNV